MQRFLLPVGIFAVALLTAYALPPAHRAFVAELQTVVPHAEPSATILFGGDMMFDRSIRAYAAENGGDYLFNCIDPVLARADLVVANLEGPITASDSVSTGSAVGSPDNYRFTFPTSTAALLVRHHIGAVNLGNNHIYNFDAAGVRSTTAALTTAGVSYFGDPLGNSVAHLQVGGVPLALINYNEFLPAGGNASTTLAQVAAAVAEGSVPVVYAHWGVEYATNAPARVVALAHEFVDAGAAAVIGSHPHVVEQSEMYHGAPVYYSLGNFIFDQYWDAAVTHGLLLELTFSSSGASPVDGLRPRVTQVKEVPVVLTRDRRVCPAE